MSHPQMAHCRCDGGLSACGYEGDFELCGHWDEDTPDYICPECSGIGTPTGLPLAGAERQWLGLAEGPRLRRGALAE